MKGPGAVVATLLLFVTPCASARAEMQASVRGVPGGGAAVTRNAQTATVGRYLAAMRDARYADAYALLDAAERSYYRDAANFAGVYAADGYRIMHFVLLRSRGGETPGRVFFARETARFRDHAHDVDLIVTATVPLGVIPEAGGWRIKDPGHPWRAFASSASADANGVRISVKKMSFFERRIEAVVSIVNTGPRFVTVLAYGKSILHDAAGRPYRIIETRDWSLTDKTLFEGLRLAPDAQYTGTLAFACDARAGASRMYSLLVSPMLVDGADAPFAISVNDIESVALPVRE